MAALSIGLLAFSQTLAWSWDEGFHLMAARLVSLGKKPYLDFFYQHPPLYPFLIAGWMRVFGEGWRGPHVLSALLTSVSIGLAAEFVLSRLPDSRWRLAGGLATALLMGLNVLVIRSGTLGLPYGMSLALMMAAFRLVLPAVMPGKRLLPLWAGLCAGAAASSSLLSLPVAPILLLWMARYSPPGARLGKCTRFVAGFALSFMPLAWLFARAPRQAVFDVLEYHLRYRGIGADIRSDLKVITGWADSAQGMLLALLVLLGLVFLAGAGEWDSRRRAEFYLCAWMGAGLGGFISFAHPTDRTYFIMLVPFVSILATVGAYALGSRVCAPAPPGWFVLLLVGLFALEPARWVYQLRGAVRWQDYEAVVREVNQVTPPQAPLFADELIYFIAGRLPPPGLENSYAPSFVLPPARAAALRIIPRSKLVDDPLAASRFATVVMDLRDPRVDRLGLRRLYASYKRFPRFHMFWNPVSTPSP